MKIVALLLLAQMQVSDVPIATTGAVEGDTLHTLSNVTAAQEDRRGNLYVVQVRTPYIAVFDSLGERIATLGREGRGPGEFTWATHVAVLHDTIFVSGSGKVAVYSPEFQHVRDVLVSNDYAGPQEILPGRRDETMRYARYAPTFVTETGFVATLATPDSMYIVFQPWRGQPTILDQYARADRFITAVVGQTTFAGIESPVPEIPSAVPAAGTLYLFRPQPAPVLREFTSARWGPTRALPLQQVFVPSTVKKEWAERFVEQWDPDELPASPAVVRRALEDAATLPERSAFTSLRAGGPDGDIWLEQKLPGRPVRMMQVTPTGQLVRTFDVPDGAAVLSVRAGHVWLLELDEYDAPFLRRYRLVQ